MTSIGHRFAPQWFAPVRATGHGNDMSNIHLLPSEAMRAWQVALLGIAVIGCSDPGPANLATGLGDAGEGFGSSSGTAGGDTGSASLTASGDSTGDPNPTNPTTSGGTSASDSDTNVGPLECTYASTTFGDPMRELDIIDDPGSSFRLSFTVPDIPDPAVIQSATLRFRGQDLDHPGEEGSIYVNDSAGYDLPANAANDNAESQEEVDIAASLVAGNNTIEFGPGPLDRSYFQIGDVEIIVVAELSDCDEPTDSEDDSGGGTGNGVEQTVEYTEADYTERNNWVWRCAGPVDYAFTAANPKHVPSDCGNAYAPDGSAHGTATFHFQDVIEDDYLVEIHAYHTFNRNPNGALLIVDGVEGTVNQRTDMEGEAFEATAEWGVAHLEGDVDITLDSSQGGYASDAVSWIRISPVP